MEQRLNYKLIVRKPRAKAYLYAKMESKQLKKTDRIASIKKAASLIFYNKD
jgi:hypothetical protein